MRIVVEIEPGEEKAALEYLHQYFPQTAPLKNVVGADLKLEGDLEVAGQTVRARVELAVSAEEPG